MPTNGETVRTTIEGLRSIADYIAELAAQEPAWTISISALRALANSLESSLPAYEPPKPTITPYSQRDPRWRNHAYAPNVTLGKYGCYITCVTMLASLAGYDDTPPQVATALKIAKAFDGGYLDHPNRITTAYPHLRWSGSLDWRKRAANLIRLRREMEDGPVIVEVEFSPGGAEPPADQHFVLAKSFTPDGQDLTIIDPWDGAETRLLERYALAKWNLARAVYGARLLKVSTP